MDSLRTIAAILMLVSAGSLHAQPLLSVNSVPAYPGATVALPVSLTRATNVVAAQFDVAFDAGRVSSGSAVPIAGLGQKVVSHEVAPGVRRVLVFSRQNTVIT